MKVLVSDPLSDVGIKIFEETPEIEVDVNTGLTPEELKGIIGSYDGLVIRSATRVTADILEGAHNLKVIGRAGTGLDNVDIRAASQRGIVVMNTPDGNTITTAEHTIAMMLSLSRNIPEGTSTMKGGKWEKKRLQGREIYNKVLGIIGFGKIGSIVADRARGLKMRVIVHDPFVTPEQIEKAGFESTSLDDLYRKSDYITVHVPKMEGTLGLLNKAAFAKMKDGAMIVNCARGGIVDEADLFDAITGGKIAGAALDVLFKEPPEADCPLFQAKNLYITPHIAWARRSARKRLMDIAVSNLEAFLSGREQNVIKPVGV